MNNYGRGRYKITASHYISVYEFCTDNDASYTEIGRHLGFDGSAMKHHLDAMVIKDILKSYKVGKRRKYQSISGVTDEQILDAYDYKLTQTAKTRALAGFNVNGIKTTPTGVIHSIDHDREHKHVANTGRHRVYVSGSTLSNAY